MARKPGARSRTARRATSGKADNRVLDVTVVLLEAGYASTAIGPIEVFHSAGLLWNWLHGETAQPRFRVRVASIDGRRVNSLCSLGLTPECAIGDIKQTDIIILPGVRLGCAGSRSRATRRCCPGCASGIPAAPTSPASARASRSWRKAGCSTAGRRPPIGAWPTSSAQRYPKVLWQPEQFVTEDGRLFCSGGVYASIDLSLYLVEKFCGHEIALQCAKSLLLSMPRSRQSGYAVVPLSRPHSDVKIRQSEEYLQEHFAGGVSIETLADRAGMGPRNFIRRFKAATGRLPGAYIQMLRVSAAKEMLEHGAAPVQTVCSKIGYEDIAFFRSLFKRHTGMTPAEYRDRFAQMTFDRGDLAA